MARETAHEIDVAAAAWVARSDRGPLSEADEAALRSWLDGDVRRLGAYGRMRGVALATERAIALGPDFDPARFGGAEAPALPRRGFLAVGAALAASATGVALLAGWRLQSGESFTTNKGEVRVVPLQDGSVVTLDTGSTITVQFTRARRDIRLVAGEALFDVAKDPARPFIVSAGATEVRAVGTSFTVRRLPDAQLRVLVREGVVEVRRNTDGRAKAVRISANTRVVATAERAVAAAEAVSPPELNRELAWRSGRIAFNGEPLSQAAEEFARYSDTRILIEDPAMRREEIAGLFQANDPVGFAQAVAASLNARTVVSEGEVRLLRADRAESHSAQEKIFPHE